MKKNNCDHSKCSDKRKVKSDFPRKKTVSHKKNDRVREESNKIIKKQV